MIRCFTACVAVGMVAAWPAGPALSQAPTTHPAKRGAAAIDHLKELVEGYHQGTERTRFFQAAGVDGELSKEEFEAAAAKAASFVRPYDHWRAAALHDLNRNGTLDWPEAEKCRTALRQKLLGLCDKDKDDRLTGAERDAARAYLARHSRTRPRPVHSANIARWDTNHDGKLDENERKAMQESYRKKAEEGRRQAELRRWDKNKDGKLDAAERAGMEAEKKRKQQAEQEMLKRWDRDGDGQLARWERYVMYKVSHPSRQRKLLRRWDKNKNGRLDEEETRTIEAYYLKRVEGMRRQDALRRYDKNRNGRLDESERAAMEADRGK